MHAHQVQAQLLASSPDYLVTMQARDHALTSDEPAEVGGADAAARPFELALAGLASCTAITIRMYAQRKQWPLGDIGIGLSLRKTGDTFEILRTVTLGGALSDEQRARIAEICEKTPVTLLMKHGASLSTTVQAGASPT
ncbi:OsmC family protein [Piscinibacter sp. XHJ-5]|uniref:OsmC family protein n=1 Tax=Piscinibacter sp. XHJ-5 TaxID=3037797 RepID=UPI002452C6D3|nr:OsmC family protein [Piscinibacter sp. XHJ-5]